MKIRCDLFLNAGHRRLILAPDQQETIDHLALKLSAYLLFWPYEPKVELSLQHPALAAQEFRPDLAGFNPLGEIVLWLECGNVTVHKLNKLTRRYPDARLVVVKASEREGAQLRGHLSSKVDRHHKVEILSWPAATFREWRRALDDQVHAVGESTERSLNLVVNETPLAVDLVSF